MHGKIDWDRYDSLHKSFPTNIVYIANRLQIGSTILKRGIIQRNLAMRLAQRRANYWKKREERNAEKSVNLETLNKIREWREILEQKRLAKEKFRELEASIKMNPYILLCKKHLFSFHSIGEHKCSNPLCFLKFPTYDDAKQGRSNEALEICNLSILTIRKYTIHTRQRIKTLKKVRVSIF
jgi:hypothetical protein